MAEEDKELLLKFKRDLKVEHEVGGKRVKKLLIYLRQVAQHLEDTTLNEAEKGDIGT